MKFRIPMQMALALTMLCLSVFSPKLMAQNVIVGSGTLSTHTCPLYMSATTSTYQYSDHISLFTAAEIQAANGGNPIAGVVSAVAWKKLNTCGYILGNAQVSIWLKNTTATTLSSANGTFPTEVATATQIFTSTTENVPEATGWVSYYSNGTFVYDGTSNLMVLVQFHRPGVHTCSNPTWEYTNVTGMGFTWADINPNPTLWSSSNNFRPNIQLSFGAVCAPPINVSAGSITSSGATISWDTLFNPISFELEYGGIGFAPGTGTLVQGITGLSHAITGLNPATNYSVYLRSICGVGDTSIWAGPFSFQTSCLTTISGTYTINSAVATGGTNFQSFADFVSAINLCGVSGPTTVNVVSGSGPYNEQVIFGAITGASSTNTITINGNGETLAFSSTNSNERAVIKLNETNYLTIDNLVIDATPVGAGTTYGFGVQFSNGADNNSLTNCTILGDLNSTSTNYAGIVFSSSATSAIGNGNSGSNNLISGNTVIGGYYGITLMGISTTGGGCDNNQILNNTISDFYQSGIRVDENNGTLIKGNDISRANRVGTTTFYGVWIESGVSKSVRVEANAIHNTHDNASSQTGAAYGLYITTNTPQPGEENVFVNNIIYNFNSGSGTQYGIWTATSDYNRIFHNTVTLDNTASTGGITYGIYQSGVGTGVDIRNNIVSITRGGTGTKRCLYYSNTGSFITSNRNVLYMGSTAGTANYIGTWGTSDNHTTLASWKTANSGLFDQQSIETDPTFVLASGGNLTPLNPLVNNIGIFVGILTDFNGNPRSMTTPDPGAVEFTPAACSPPVGGFATNITGTTATLNWSEVATAVSYKVEYGATGFAPGTGTGHTGIIDTFFNVTGLSPLTSYDFYVRAVCGPGDSSIWVGPNTFSTGCLAALSGTYTINSAVVTGGTNFQSFTDFVTELNLCGVSGPVTVNVATGSGPYNEQVIFTAYTGASSVNSVTINGNGETIAFSSTNTNERAVIKLNGANFITLDNLVIDGTPVGTGTTYGFTVQLGNGADNNVINNCTILSDVASSSLNYAGIVLSASATSSIGNGNSGSNNIISNNTIIGGYRGISMMGIATTGGGCDNNQVINNIIRDFYESGVRIDEANGTLVKGNDISRTNRVLTTTFYGVHIEAGTTKNTLIDANFIYDTHNNASTQTGAAYGLYITGCDAPIGEENVFTNNVMYNFNSGSGSIYGIYNSSSDGHFCYHNTVSLDHAASTGGLAYAYYQVTLATNVEILNNIFYINRGGSGTKYCLYFATTTSDIYSDHNVLFNGSTSGTNGIGYYSSGQTTLAAWQAVNGGAYDQQSVSADPLFISSTGGNLTPLSNAVNNIGLYVGVDFDIYGNPRSLSAPDPGAVEFTPAACSPPLGSTVTGLSGTTADLTWGEVSAAQSYEVEYGPSGFTPGTGMTITGITDTFTTLTGLAPTTDYHYYLKAVCAPGDSSLQVGPFSFQTGCLSALSGVYTINSAVATGGTNFQSFSDFALELNLCGVSGPVTVNVVSGSGPYNEQIILNDYFGASASNPVVLNGNGETLVFASSNTNQRAVITFNGADYVTIDNLIINSQGGSFGWGIFMTNGSDYNTISNCTIEGDLSGTSSNWCGVVVSGSATSALTNGNNGAFNSFLNNDISGGYYGLTVIGPTTGSAGTVISGNTVRDFYFYGIYLDEQIEPVVTGNDVHRMNRVTVSTFYGIYFSAGVTKGAWVEGNRIHDTHTSASTQTGAAYGLYVTGCDAPVGEENVFVNNAVYNFNSASGSIYGIYNSSSDGHLNYHNTLNFDNASSTSGLVYGIYQITLATNVEILNNIVSISRGGTGTKYCLYFSTTTSDILSDHNVLVNTSSAGTNGIGYYSSGQTTLAAWQTVNGGIYDNNSVSAVPFFVNAAAGDLTPQSGMIDNIGTGLGIATDILGASRSMSTPDAGAWEFNPVGCLPPTVSGFTNITTNSADIIFSTNNMSPGTYEVEFGLTGFTPGTGTTDTGIVSSPYTITGLSSGKFDVYIRENCGSSYSQWSGPVSVCITPVIVSSYPYSYDFETYDGSNFDCGWSVFDVNGDSRTWVPHVATADANSGNVCARINWATTTFGGPVNDWMVSPGFQMNAGATYQLTFYYKKYTSGSENFAVYVGNSSNPASMTTLLVDYPNVPNTTYLQSVNFFTPSASDVYYFGWYCYSINNQWYVYIDDVEVSVVPGCSDPAQFAATNIGNSTATLNWDPSSFSPGTFNIEYGPAGFTPGTGSTISGLTGTSFGLTGLSPNTSYDWYIRQYCANGDSSILVGPASFQTICVLTVNGTVTDAGCQGTMKGTVVLSVTGGTIPLSYTWSNGSTMGNLINVNPGSYSVTVTDANGCTGTESFNISQFSYCPVTGNPGGQWINQVCVFNACHNSLNDGGYGNYSNLFGKVTIGGTLLVKLLPNGVNPNAIWKLYIDYNRNCDFSDPGELVFQTTTPSNTQVQGTFQISPTATPGPVRFRVMMGNAITDACTNITNGEVQDYTLILSKPYCQAGGQSTSLLWINSWCANTQCINSGNNNGFVDFNTTVTLPANATLNLTLNPGYGGSPLPVYWALYYDVNRNGSWDDPEDLRFYTQVPVVGEVTGQFTIPSYAVNGNTRLRLVASLDPITSSCGTIANGEVEIVRLKTTGGSGPRIFFEETESLEGSIEATLAQKPGLGFVVFPNPLGDRISANIQLDAPAEDVTIQVYDISGRIVYENAFSMVEAGQVISLPMDNAANGLYQVVIRSRNETGVQKLVIAR